ncbi:arsenate reductase [Inhella inkyongensis]|uniref:Arsenate reductase n=1 Tax=Inhella inkyongensis TaxID=392593 RepID=A0A840S5W8_9BURK|nr:arsenate reductase (glutaredoxin) [Inhella inkyongensis]MBB5203890.1 arsenate reductase [Inhella inkyongensis]
MTDITIFHNPRCSNSRNVLALLRHAGCEPQIVDYLTAPLDAPQLLALAQATGLGLRGLMRDKEVAYSALGLGRDDVDETTLLEALQRHPELLNRPIVVSSRGAALCRPPQTAFELLPCAGPLPPFTLENGQQVWDSGLRR